MGTVKEAMQGDIERRLRGFALLDSHLSLRHIYSHARNPCCSISIDHILNIMMNGNLSQLTLAFLARLGT